MLSCIMQMRLRSSTRPVKGPETSSARASPARAVRARAIASIRMRIDSKGGASHVPATAGTGRDAGQARDAGVGMPPMDDFDGRVRSEEHTSELQSHSFISYAVFCLKKKN